jgi:hypothetical protein
MVLVRELVLVLDLCASLVSLHWKKPVNEGKPTATAFAQPLEWVRFHGHGAKLGT